MMIDGNPGPCNGRNLVTGLKETQKGKGAGGAWRGGKINRLQLERAGIRFNHHYKAVLETIATTR